MRHGDYEYISRKFLIFRACDRIIASYVIDQQACCYWCHHDCVEAFEEGFVLPSLQFLKICQKVSIKACRFYPTVLVSIQSKCFWSMVWLIICRIRKNPLRRGIHFRYRCSGYNDACDVEKTSRTKVGRQDIWQGRFKVFFLGGSDGIGKGVSILEKQKHCRYIYNPLWKSKYT